MWPRLVGSGGTCLTCAGLLFAWMAMTGNNQTTLFISAGILSGLGASIQMTQCDILLSQYFRIKLPVLNQLSQAVAAFGFILAPILLGQHIINNSLLHIILWYQAVLLQGLIANIAFRKPLYLKFKQRSSYRFVSSNADDEEDIFSKNSRELQIKRQNSRDTTIETIEINKIDDGNRPSTSSNEETETKTTKWETFDEDSVKPDWETFNNEDVLAEVKQNKPATWTSFNDADKKVNNNKTQNYLQLSFAEESQPHERLPDDHITDLPTPLFSDIPVNNNNTYAYDDEEIRVESHPVVFLPNTRPQTNDSNTLLNLFKQPTFYKSLLTLITTKYSIFIFFSLFPSYLYVEVENFNVRRMTLFVGCLSFTTLLFSCCCIKVNKQLKAICLWVLCWTGTLGYFLLSDYNMNLYGLIAGAILTVLSISALQQIGIPLLVLTIRGDTNQEYKWLSVLSSLAFGFFLVFNLKYKDCFRLMAVLQFVTGCLWFSNYIYKKIKHIH